MATPTPPYSSPVRTSDIDRVNLERGRVPGIFCGRGRGAELYRKSDAQFFFRCKSSRQLEQPRECSQLCQSISGTELRTPQRFGTLAVDY